MYCVFHTYVLICVYFIPGIGVGTGGGAGAPPISKDIVLFSYIDYY